MAVMSYCKFEELHREFNECYEILSSEKTIQELSETEREYALKVIKMAGDFYDDFEYELPD